MKKRFIQLFCNLFCVKPTDFDVLYYAVQHFRTDWVFFIFHIHSTGKFIVVNSYAKSSCLSMIDIDECDSFSDAVSRVRYYIGR